MNVWVALAASEHIHSAIASRWWELETGTIAFSRLTQLGLLRLLTTSAAMDGKPLSITEAWRVHDRFYDDDRVTFLSEPPEVERAFRKLATGKTASPKLWADVWLLAFAQATGGKLVTLDKALALRGAICLLPSAN